MTRPAPCLRPMAWNFAWPVFALLCGLCAWTPWRGVAGESPAAGVLTNPHGMKLAVTVLPQTPASDAWVRSAQTRLEQILADNGATVLDEAKMNELKDVARLRNDPTTFVSAETFLEAAQRYSIAGLLAVYLTVEVAPGLADYYTATAQADVRCIDQATARVASFAAPSMGSPGMPPSDGLTASSAALNAVQRAVDAACAAIGLQLAERAEARTVDLTLAGPGVPSDANIGAEGSPLDPALVALVPLEARKWLSEEATCTARAPGGKLAAVAGYIRDTDLRRRPERLYGARIHIVETETRRELLTLECSPVAIKARDEPHSKKVVACLFLGSWRYLCAATGNHLLLWDIERGRELARVPLAAEPTGLAMEAAGGGTFVLVRGASGSVAHRVMVRR